MFLGQEKTIYVLYLPIGSTCFDMKSKIAVKKHENKF